MYSFKFEDDSKNKLKGVSKSQSKHIKFDEYTKCLDGKENQRECDNYLLRLIKKKINLQKLKKSTLSIFDDKRCYESKIKSLPWKQKKYGFEYVMWNVNMLDICIFEMVLIMIRIMILCFFEFLDRR